MVLQSPIPLVIPAYFTQVLLKRKPVKYLPPPRIHDQNVEVWVMPSTGEVFTNYEAYLLRLDFYKQHQFTCPATGQSGLTFFDALASERNETRSVDNRFPEALKEPVCRKIQFSTISRMEDLVQHVYDEFKQEFFPGEHVTCLYENGDRLDGVVRDKVSFQEQRSPDGELIRKAFSRYFIRLFDREHEEALLDNDRIIRSRKNFSKHVLRVFLKNSLTKEPWAGAPWCLKIELANQYKIPTEVPARLLQENRQAERKAHLALKREEQDGTFFQFFAGQQMPSGAGRRKLSQLDIQKRKEIQLQQYQEAMAAGQVHPFTGAPGFQVSHPTHLTHPTLPAHPSPFQTFYAPPVYPQIVSRQPQMPPPPPPIKYPIEDLDIEPKRNSVQRPQLRFLAMHGLTQNGDTSNVNSTDSRLAMKSIGPLLETWNTLNVLCQPFILDSFTLDDFIDAMSLPADANNCELLEEIHCAVLSLLVDEDGQLKVSLPELDEDEEDEEEDEEMEDSTLSTPLPDAPARSTRSSLAKQEAAALQEESNRVSPSTKLPRHRATEMLAERGWIERCGAREFEEGGWQTILVGLIHQISLHPSNKDACDEILAYLSPANKEPTPETAQEQYASMNVNLRISALQMIVILAPTTKTIRSYLEECSEAMTQMRKDKIEQQRLKKPLIEELHDLDNQRKMLLPDNMPDSDTEEKNETADVDMDVSEDLVADGDKTEDSDDEPRTRSLRRNSGRALERKRKREEDAARKEKEKREKEAAKASKQSTAFKKLLKDIDKKKEAIKGCEDAIADLDNDLREANCQRTKCVGRDRYWNRYWWFERNGMPFAGLPEASTSEYGYANGRLWVQGPDEAERKGFVDLSDEEMNQYKARHGVAVPDREKQELGPTRLFSANEWAYYDSPEAIDALIAWLDDRGKREKDLRKELMNWRDPIAQQMEKLTAHLLERNHKREEADEEAATGITTRHSKSNVDKDTRRHPCLEWRNNLAIQEMGKRHAEPADNKKKKKQKKGVAQLVTRKKPVVVEPSPEPLPPRRAKTDSRNSRNSRR
ncbi:MAG: hypothetical protein M1820_006912 [Bogoriella megaspora]|nr:MAG: hypothetical protein M1820_006912 [Bogoriella megaspora]